jgi:hypothetical protein
MSEIELRQRLEKLERDNRRFKRLGIAALALVAGLVTIAATRPVPDKIAAHEFDMLDSSGKVRVKIAMDCPSKFSAFCWPDIDLYDESGKMRTAIDAGMLSISSSEGNATLSVDVNGPAFEIVDPQGFRMNLGGTATVTPKTGQTQHTSAASIVMFGNDKKHHVIWRAP